MNYTEYIYIWHARFFLEKVDDLFSRRPQKTVYVAGALRVPGGCTYKFSL